MNAIENDLYLEDKQNFTLISELLIKIRFNIRCPSTKTKISPPIVSKKNLVFIVTIFL